MPPAAAFNPPSFDLAYVISDLHLGGPLERQMFAAGDQFTAFIEHVLGERRRLRKENKQARVLLVINGDFVDFLAEESAQEFNLESSPCMLVEILKRDPFNKVRDGLRKFVAIDGTHLAITLGNHDVELALPATRRVLLEELTKPADSQAKAEPNPALEGKIELCFDGWGYRFQVGGRRALCLHGNESDEYNFTRYDELDRIIRDIYLFDKSEFAAKWRPSAGSWFVINAVNRVKKDYPFVDLLKPEKSVMPTVLAVLDPSKVLYLEEAARMASEAFLNEKVRPSSQRRMLSVEQSAAGAEALTGAPGRRPGPSAAAIEDRVERALADGTIEELIHLPVDARMLGMGEWVDNVVQQIKNEVGKVGAALTDAAKKVMLQGLLRPMLTDDPHDVGALASADLDINRGVRADYDVVFAGHTHVRRIARRPKTEGIKAEGFYVNTGTWAGLMSLTRSDLDSQRFQEVYDALSSGKRPDLDKAKLVRHECTFARMEEAAKEVTVTLGGVDAAMVKDVKAMTLPARK
jgi:UDP-2,3-diacylglucosamine pyrophosphatase LpxH